MIKGVIFDVGGVLAYDVWEHLLCDPPGAPRSIAVEYGIPPEKLEQVGQELWANFDRRGGDPDDLEKEYWEQFLGRVRGFPGLANVTVPDLVAMTDAFVRPVSEHETADLLAWLTRKGVCLGICSNNNEFWSTRQMRKLRLYRYFSPNRVILSCQHGITKSDHRLFHIAADALRLHPTECAFVDDRMGNVSRAIDCGMLGLLVATEQFPAKPQGGTRYLRRVLEEVLV